MSANKYTSVTQNQPDPQGEQAKPKFRRYSFVNGKEDRLFVDINANGSATLRFQDSAQHPCGEYLWTEIILGQQDVPVLQLLAEHLRNGKYCLHPKQVIDSNTWRRCCTSCPKTFPQLCGYGGCKEEILWEEIPADEGGNGAKCRLRSKHCVSCVRREREREEQDAERRALLFQEQKEREAKAAQRRAERAAKKLKETSAV
jgi:hypothetical protein